MEENEPITLLAIDHVHSIAGTRLLEESLFHLYNHMQSLAVPIMFSANRSPNHLPFALPDMRTRMAHGLVLAVEPSSDKEIIATLAHYFLAHGWSWEEGLPRYLVNYVSRDLHTLFRLFHDINDVKSEGKLTVQWVARFLREQNITH